MSGDRRGFTLLEIMIATTILAVAATIIWSSFNVTLDAWKRGGEALDKMHHGDFVMEQLVGALRSTAVFPNKPDRYGFWLEAKEGGFPEDEISWVTSSSAFIPPDSPLARGLHRLAVGIEDDDEGRPSFTVRAFPHMADELDREEADVWHISSRVQGLRCRVYNFEEEDWDEEWEDTNSVPRLLEITLYLEPLEEGDEPMISSRLVEIPLAPATTGAVAAVVGGGGGATGSRTNALPGTRSPGGATGENRPVRPRPDRIGGVRIQP